MPKRWLRYAAAYRTSGAKACRGMQRLIARSMDGSISMQAQRQDSAFSIARIEPINIPTSELPLTMSRQGTIQGDASKLLISPHQDEDIHEEDHGSQPSFLAEHIACKYFGRAPTPKGPSSCNHQLLWPNIKIEMDADTPTIGLNKTHNPGPMDNIRLVARVDKDTEEQPAHKT